ncbi:glycerate kinase [Novosphingobium sp. BL-52-GroH]|uniref:glycerate kinase type-2 family protein n=1 Tax=Novosphingobium sp. BL-52-GroH TaxID=3349877 RepID=UPI00384F9FC4
MSLARNRDRLAELFYAAINAVRGDRLIAERSRLEGGVWTYRDGGRTVRFDLPDDGRVIVIGAGKAAASLALGLQQVLGERIDGGCVIVKYGHGEDLDRIQVLEAGHPVPDAAGVAATRRLLGTVEGLGPNDRVFLLLTGGASALLVAPADGLTLEDKAATTEFLLRCGASIQEINTVRRHISKVKGGRLLDQIGEARLITLSISDIPDGDKRLIGSGPSSPDELTPSACVTILQRYGGLEQVPPAVIACPSEGGSTRAAERTSPEHIVLADIDTALDAMTARAEALGYEVVVLDRRMAGDTHAAARQFGAAMRERAAAGGGRPTVFLAGGETTLVVTGSGQGGRNQEFSLVIAEELEGVDNVAALAAGTDGTDGPTTAAGGFVDGSTVQRAESKGCRIHEFVVRNDSYNFLDSINDVFVTGSTGTNVMDVVIGIAD